MKEKVIVTDVEGKILSIDDSSEHDSSSVNFLSGAICPGFINAHCHLELSYMRGRVPKEKGLAQFIRDLLSIRNERMEIVMEEIVKADEEMRRNGIVAVGDICNDDHTLNTKSKSKIFYHSFVEAYGFIPANTAKYFSAALNVFTKAREKNLSASITPHAPYSVPEELMKKIFSFSENEKQIFSIHNQETEAETQFFANGTGDFTKLLNEFFKLNSSEVFHPTGERSVNYLLKFIPKEKNVLLVHNTFTSEEEMKNISNEFSKVYWCTCPRANLYIENRLPDYKRWMSVNDRICIGTDSVASNDVLSIFEEMKTIQQKNSFISTEQLIQWATINGAKFLELNDQFGSIEIGKTPGLNLISDLNEKNMLSENSAVRKII